MALFAVFAAAALAQPATITTVSNNYSNIVSGLPNYGIAQGSIFFIKGSNLAPGTTTLQNPQLKTSLNGVTIQVSINGVNTSPLIYYLSPRQIDAVLPSNTPVGTGTITVTNNGSSASAPVQVVQSAFGLLTLNGAGTGLIGAYDANNNNIFLSSTAAANPGDVIVLWGSGLGPISGDDSVAPAQTNMTTPITVYIGGVSATVNYHGRSSYPGLDQINVVVPQNVSGCAVSVAVQTGDYISNFGTMPIAATGRTCSDPALGVTSAQLQSLITKGSYSGGTINLNQTTTTAIAGIGEGGHPIPGQTTTATSASAAFFKVNVPQSFDFSALTQSVSAGSCVVYTGGGNTPSVVTGITTTNLNAGPTISGTGPSGSASMSYANGAYNTTLLNGFMAPGAYSFNNAGGGPDVGAFTAQFTLPSNLQWPDIQSFNNITRSSGVTINWTGGDPGTYVTISGMSLNSGGGQPIFGYFLCTAPTSAGTFTVPPFVLTALPASSLFAGNTTSTLAISNITNPAPFTPSSPAVDYAFIGATFVTSKLVFYQ